MQRKTGKHGPYSRKRAVNKIQVSPNVEFCRQRPQLKENVFKELKENMTVTQQIR